MILHGIEYQRPTSLNMRILADHVTYSFLAFMKSIFHFCLGCYCGGYSQNGRSNLSSCGRWGHSPLVYILLGAANWSRLTVFQHLTSLFLPLKPLLIEFNWVLIQCIVVSYLKVIVLTLVCVACILCKSMEHKTEMYYVMAWVPSLIARVHGANMGPTWRRQDPCGPHVGPMSLVIWVKPSPCILHFRDPRLIWCRASLSYLLSCLDYLWLGVEKRRKEHCWGDCLRWFQNGFNLLSWKVKYMLFSYIGSIWWFDISFS